MGKFVYTDLRGNRQEVSYTNKKRGSFSTVYLTGESAYISCADDCYDKEILRNIEPSRHIPQCEHVGYDGNTNTVFKMPQYHKLTKADTAAWADYQYLRKLFNRAGNLFIANAHDAFKRAAAMIDAMGDCESSICEAFRLLDSWATAYGAQYCVEISPRNLAVDSNGDLILLDCYFDMEKLREKFNRVRYGK